MITRWIDHMSDEGRIPLLFFLVGFLAGFAFIRFSVRMIRARVRWWPGNVTPGGHHVHHVVFGTVCMLVSGVALVAVYVDGTQTTGAVLATFFGIGAALVLDEFALIFYLEDVYWAEQGRTSVDAVFVAVAVTVMLLFGLRPLEFFDVAGFRDDPDPVVRALIVALAALNLLLAAIVLAKGKIWTGLVGLFFLPLLLVGALRLGRPGSPWARWRYTRRPKRMARAVRRERNVRRPVVRAKIWTQDLIAGQPDAAHVRAAAEDVLDRIVLPAPPPHAERPADTDRESVAAR
ncbi:hypothetical protein [Rhodococcoides corynebacterioides]|uniref:hypothetical protein n=1 Tax=Rhodococcoides corynebacterioides TaxID=53972 RepID=UPI003AE74061